MTYTIASDLKVCGKVKGDSLTKEELVKAGANIQALIDAGHLKTTTPTISAKPVTTEGATRI
tara:strand:- start:685 stop:870 length:186 start_codon:yes stop_codon:yes gene_type:complete